MAQMHDMTERALNAANTVRVSVLLVSLVMLVVLSVCFVCYGWVNCDHFVVCRTDVDEFIS